MAINEHLAQQYDPSWNEQNSQRTPAKSVMDEHMENFIEIYGQRAWREFLSTGKVPDQPQYPNGKANGTQKIFSL